MYDMQPLRTHFDFSFYTMAFIAFGW